MAKQQAVQDGWRMGTEKEEGGKTLEREPDLAGHPKGFVFFLMGTEPWESWLD